MHCFRGTSKTLLSCLLSPPPSLPLCPGQLFPHSTLCALLRPQKIDPRLGHGSCSMASGLRIAPRGVPNARPSSGRAAPLAASRGVCPLPPSGAERREGGGCAPAAGAPTAQRCRRPSCFLISGDSALYNFGQRRRQRQGGEVRQEQAGVPCRRHGRLRVAPRAEAAGKAGAERAEGGAVLAPPPPPRRAAGGSSIEGRTGRGGRLQGKGGAPYRRHRRRCVAPWAAAAGKARAVAPGKAGAARAGGSAVSAPPLPPRGPASGGWRGDRGSWGGRMQGQGRAPCRRHRRWRVVARQAAAAARCNLRALGRLRGGPASRRRRAQRLCARRRCACGDSVGGRVQQRGERGSGVGETPWLRRQLSVD